MEHLPAVMQSYMGEDILYFRTSFPFPEHYACDNVRDILVAGNVPAQYSVLDIVAVMKKVNLKPAPSVAIEYYTSWMERKEVILNTFKIMKTHIASVAF